MVVQRGRRVAVSPLSGVLTEAGGLYRRFAGHFLLISFVICLITAVLVALLSLAGVAGVIIGAIISFAATYVVQASKSGSNARRCWFITRQWGGRHANPAS
jgi:hypothetical protein